MNQEWKIPTKKGDFDQAADLRSIAAGGDRGGRSVRGAGRCIAIGSGKGGVGKTVVSVGLSIALRERGRRVLLFDGDMGLANVDLQMGLIPEHTIQDVIFGHCPIDKACLRVPDGPDVLVAASGAPELADLSGARRRMFIADLFSFSARYDFFIVDTGAGIGGATTDFLAACPEVMIVLANEPTALMDAYALIKTLHLRGGNHGIGVVVNMADSLDDGERVFERLNGITRRFLGLDLFLAGVIVFDRRVSQAIRMQQSIVQYAGDGKVARCLRDLADHMIGHRQKAPQRPDLDNWMRQWALADFLKPESEEDS